MFLFAAGMLHAGQQAAPAPPVLDDTRNYRERENLQALPKSPIGQAIPCALSNWDALIRYCQDGDLEIDNNGAERSLRGVALSSKLST